MWSLAQVEQQKEDAEERGDATACQKRWVPPPKGWFKCNIGVDWMKGTRLAGGAWVLRDEKGKVILHGRRAFSEIGCLHDAKLQVLVWSVESIVSHHQNKVIFALDDGDITQMVLRPKAWPNFKGEIELILGKLCGLEWWRLVKEDRANNRGALLIAKGVTKGGQTQSYVAAGPPAWLLDCFENEEILSSA
ncbi:hypothetical protein DY000_02033214 [Brassica cretica]|uniref:RNase H type-1 domain-containing protein n=1 Tax=Brassica cretica TaxID=69181 RepID=A0ABQ7DJL2_BRACR|nr:hypothetical protein DY000_02033214 [Brassica cretica]